MVQLHSLDGVTVGTIVVTTIITPRAAGPDGTKTLQVLM
jgi:hypothetical protein